MPIRARQEYLALLWLQYQETQSRRRHTQILDEIVKNLGMNRSYACRIMRGAEAPITKKQRRSRKRTYSPESRLHIGKLWLEMNRPGGKKMQAAWVDWLDFYSCPLKVKQEIYRMSPATIDRILKPIRAEYRRKHNTGTRAVKKKHCNVPIKPLGYVPKNVGFVEVDTVAHCGGSMSGHFIWTLTVVELVSRWTECRIVWNKESYEVRNKLMDIEASVPYVLNGMSVDGGSEFINHEVVDTFCKDPTRLSPLPIVRSRPYRKNDQAYVEQKNHTHVRNLLGYGRLDSKVMMGLIEKTYEDWCLLQNYFVPQVRLLSKIREGSHLKRSYSKPKTPFEALLESEEISQCAKDRLLQTKKMLNPFLLQSKIRKRLNQIWRWHNVHVNDRGRVAA